ncbi:hypothetical protein [Streptomyces hypolithicus]
MASKERDTKPQAEHICPVCKQILPTEVHRHKTLGMYVPIWRPGPCQNPDCGSYDEAHTPAEHRKPNAHA